MIYLVLYDTGRHSRKDECLLFFLVIYIRKFYSGATTHLSSFSRNRKTAFIFHISFRRSFNNFWIEHNNCFIVFIVPITKQTCNNQSDIVPHLRSSKSYTIIFWIFDKVIHFFSKSEIFWNFGHFDKFTLRSEYLVFVSGFYMKHVGKIIINNGKFWGFGVLYEKLWRFQIKIITINQFKYAEG